MQIKATSQLTGKEHTMDIPGVTQERLNKCWRFNPNREGKHIQDEFPELTPDQREFLMTGITPDEWESLRPTDADD